LTLAWVRRERRPDHDLLLAAGAGLLLVPSLAQSFGADGFRWALLGGAEGLVFVLVGLAVRRRMAVAAGVISLTAIVLRQTVDYVNSLPTWAILGTVGLSLLVAGTVWLAARDTLIRQVADARQGWRDLD